MEIIDFIKEWGYIVTSISTCIISCISLYMSSKSLTLQNRVNELEIAIKQNELMRIEKEKEEEKEFFSRVEARIINYSSKKHMIRICNSGLTIVKNVNITTDLGVNLLQDGILPYEELEANNYFEVNIIKCWGMDKKFYVNISWSDVNGVENNKRQLLSL